MSQSAFFWPGDSFMTTLMPASWARLKTGSSALPSFGTTPITSTFLAIRSSIARTCWAGSSVVGLIIEASTPRSWPAFSTPFSTLSNHGIFTFADDADLGRVVGGAVRRPGQAPMRRRVPRRPARECDVICHALNSSLIQSGQTTSNRSICRTQDGLAWSAQSDRLERSRECGNVLLDHRARACLDVVEVGSHRVPRPRRCLPASIARTMAVCSPRLRRISATFSVARRRISRPML